MTTATATEQIEIGTVVSYGDMANPRREYVVATLPDQHGRQVVVAVDGDPYWTTVHPHLFVPAHHAGGWHITAREPWSPARVDVHAEAVFAAAERALAAQRAAADKRRADVERGKALLAAAAPEGTAGYMVAELIEDRSDVMSDYFGHTVRRALFLGFTSSKRDSFREMRAAAARTPETRPLATAGKDAEHREKYSMGGGYYLKAGGRDDNGWSVRRVTWLTDEVALSFLAFAEAAPDA